MASKTLYCVLNWGLGHASRSIPIIREQLALGHDVTIASDGHALTLLQQAFPELPHTQLPAYDITYKYNSIAANILGQCLKILRTIKTENSFLKTLVKDYKFTRIISDNRFGCYHSDCENIFVTHQLRLIHKQRFIQAAATKLNLRMIQKFHECWIPDEEDARLSGNMSSGVKLEIPVRNIGIKSRFSHLHIKNAPAYKSVSVLSGPEPQRTYLQDILSSQLTDIPGRHVIITGVERETVHQGNITFRGLLNVKQLSEVIENSEHIISRSGYSSIMDYEAMQRKAILIPTPGQTEQEYLARRAGASGRHSVMSQDRVELAKILT